MELHHSKHHQTYVTGLNTAEAALVRATSPKERISLQPALKFNGGGHINHSLFWKNLSPANQDGGKLSNGPLKEALIADFGSVDEFKKLMNSVTAAVQGSGWGWLVRGFCYVHQPPIIIVDGTASGVQQVYQEA
jgi:Fe-Mn family superoxide dismutase